MMSKKKSECNRKAYSFVDDHGISVSGAFEWAQIRKRLTGKTWYTIGPWSYIMTSKTALKD